MTVIAQAEGVHPLFAGSDRPINLDMVNNRWTVLSEANPRMSVLRADLGTGRVATFRLSTLSAPVKANNTATLNLGGNTQARWRTFEDHVKFEATFDGIPTIDKITFGVTLANLTLVPADDGAWDLVDGTERVGGLPRPWIEYDVGGDPQGRIRRMLDYERTQTGLSIALPTDLTEDEWLTALLDPTVVTTSVVNTATAYGNQRKIDRCQNGQKWMMTTENLTSANAITGNKWGHCRFFYESGGSWTEASSFQIGSTNNYVVNGSFFIDVDDYAHIVYKHSSDGFLYYRRGTPNAGRTAWTWSLATQVVGFSGVNYPDVVAHKEGTGYRVHIVSSYNGASTPITYYNRLDINNVGTISIGVATTTLGSYSGIGAQYTYPSIDFHHTGDGKTVAGGAPHLFVAWSSANTGSGYGIRFKKGTYSGGSHSWGTERGLDNDHWVPSDAAWLNCLFDGTRVIVGGLCYSTAPVGYDTILIDRDVNDTTTTARILIDDVNTQEKFRGSMTYDGDGNVYIFGANDDEPAGSNDLVYQKWVRATTTLEPEVVIDANGTFHPFFSAKRGYSSGVIEFVYMDNTASPYDVIYDSFPVGSPAKVAMLI